MISKLRRLFKKPVMECIGDSVSPGYTNAAMGVCIESRLRMFKRWILRARWQHHDIANPCDVSLGIYRTPQCDGETLAETIYAKDAIILRTEVSPSLADIIRCLFGCTLKVNSVVYCENEPGRIKTESHSFASL